MKAFIVQAGDRGNIWDPIGEVSKNNMRGLNVDLSAVPTQREVVVFGKTEQDLQMLEDVAQTMKVLMPAEWVDAEGDVHTKWTDLGRAWKQTRGCKIVLRAIPTGKRLVLVPLHVTPETQASQQTPGPGPETQAAQQAPATPPQVESAVEVPVEEKPPVPSPRRKTAEAAGVAAGPVEVETPAPKKRKSRAKRTQEGE